MYITDRERSNRRLAEAIAEAREDRERESGRRGSVEHRLSVPIDCSERVATKTLGEDGTPERVISKGENEKMIGTRGYSRRQP